MKRIPGLVAAFAFGLAIALAWAAARRPPQTAPISASQPAGRSPSPQAPVEAPRDEETLEPPDDASRELDQVASGALGERPVMEDPTVKTWDEFYQATRILGITDVDLLRQIIGRLGREIGLSHVDSVHLEELIVREQLAVTRSALRRYGDSIASLVAAEGGPGAAFWEELRGLRKEVRDRFEAEYVTRFAPDQMKAINLHLRNDQIRVTEYQKGPVSRFLVSGFGR